jgi:hypothetical protein
VNPLRDCAAMRGARATTILLVAAGLTLGAAACGNTQQKDNAYGTFTDCATVGTPVVTNDPAGDMRTTQGAKRQGSAQGDLIRLRVAKNAAGTRLCAEFTAAGKVKPYVAYVLTMRPQATDTPVVQLEANVLGGVKPEADLDADENGKDFRKIPATIGIRGDRLSIVVDKTVFDRVGVGDIFRSFRFQARSAVAAEDDQRLTDCLPVCE